jgi:Phage integrase SAM-like domain
MLCCRLMNVVKSFRKPISKLSGTSRETPTGHYRMAWIVKLPPTPATPKPAGRSATATAPPSAPPAIYPTKAEALSVKRALEQAEHVASSDQPASEQKSMLFGQYVATIWWPAWKPAHPRSANGTRSKLTARILPHFGDLALAELDARAAAAWQRAMTREGLSPRTIATYLSLLGTICNAAVDTGYLDHSPSPLPAAVDDGPRPHRHADRAIPATHDLAHPPAGAPARRRHRPALPRPGRAGRSHRRPLERTDHPALD